METSNCPNISTSDSIGCDNCWLNKFSTNKNWPPESDDTSLWRKEALEYDKGTCLIKSGDKVAGIYCIRNGLVKISKKGKRNKEFILWIASQNDIIGLNSFINDDVYSFSATTINKIKACFIPVSDLKILLGKEPMIFVQLMRKLCKKLDFVEHRITSLSGKSIRAQCAEILISIATKNNPESDKTLQINYSVRDIASLIGTTRNYLYKILLEFTNREILTVRNRKFVIKNLNALSLIADGNDKLSE